MSDHGHTYICVKERVLAGDIVEGEVRAPINLEPGDSLMLRWGLLISVRRGRVIWGADLNGRPISRFAIDILWRRSDHAPLTQER